MQKIFFIIIAILTLSSCHNYPVPTTTATSDVDFSEYRFAVLRTDGFGFNTNATILNETFKKIKNVLIFYKFTVIENTKKAISALDYEEQLKLFVVGITISSILDSTECIIYFKDYLSGDLIATFKSYSVYGYNREEDQRVAVNSAINQMINMLENNNNI
jgi:hypothetical protein